MVTTLFASRLVAFAIIDLLRVLDCYGRRSMIRSVERPVRLSVATVVGRETEGR
jgi:hypothetical protein